MSLLNPNTLQQQLFVSQPVLPYTFTTGELDSLKTKLQLAENQLMGKPNQTALLQISIAEIRTLLKMIDMTYLQGLSGSGVLPSLSTPEISTNNGGKQPMGNYICRKCHIPGHFIQDCPNVGNNNNNNNSNNNNFNNNYNGMQNKRQQNVPPMDYVCRKCQTRGHWIQDCTASQQDFNKHPPNNYICHRCGTQGHWIKYCPTNGNPSYDNKSHMISQNEEDNNNNNSQQQNTSNSPNGKFQKRFVKKTM